MTNKKRFALLAVLIAGVAGAVLFGDATLKRASLLMTANPIASTPTEIARGAALFTQHCTACHGDDPHTRAPDVPDLTQLNRPASVLAMRITYGVGDGMPAWDGVLSAHEIWQLVTYVQTLQQPGGGWRGGRAGGG
ncbi:cbb3-type cytochrome c oxidase subunit III [Roseinatronobacter monicus]|uniref:Cbb3-type cytochrome c oxidase subunit III n=2 Tax=Roseinatronobacter monicus TaxID=393481 RepID=A0A543K4B6_9RHOB|nr:cbb3-type cytochrome c oxidase subunit III [Roseinatronobacter monicus]